jgi:hypothetical protein
VTIQEPVEVPDAARAEAAGQPQAGPCRLYVPVRDAGGAVALRLFRDRFGERCAVGFTTAGMLRCVLGRRTRYFRLSESLIRELARAGGAEMLVVDPGLVAAPVGGSVNGGPAKLDADRPPAAAPSSAGSATAGLVPAGSAQSPR